MNVGFGVSLVAVASGGQCYMRVESGIVIFALAVGAAFYYLCLLFGLIPMPWLPLAVAVVVGSLLYLPIFMAQHAVDVKELVKQIAVWLGIVVLLPLAVWYGASAFSSPPDWKQYSKDTARLAGKIPAAAGEAEKEKLQQQMDQLETAHEEAQRVYYRDMFWIAYPAGVAAVIVGIFFPVQAVGAGFMFGGLLALAAGCYSYWDKMEGWLRFASLIVALILLVVLGTWRFRSGGSGSVAPAEPRGCT